MVGVEPRSLIFNERPESFSVFFNEPDSRDAASRERGQFNLTAFPTAPGPSQIPAKAEHF